MSTCLCLYKVNFPTKSAYTMAYRRAGTLLTTGKECFFSKSIPLFQNSPNVISQTVKLQNHRGRATRTLHTGAPLLVAKLLSVDELFARRSLREYLKKMETEYSECLRAVNRSPMEEPYNEDELRTKRSKVPLLAPLIQSIRELDTKHKEIAETEMLLKDEDPALRELAELEREDCLQDIQDLRQKILDLLIPEEEADLSDLILEVTAGVGGQEAMLFTAEVLDMYQGFAQHHGWSFDILEHMTSELGGLRHASASISGPQSYKRMKFEAGVHRVQRVPKTEKQGRMHTSTMTVAVLPQPTEISFTINPKDLRIDTKRASGAGGQHVNTTDSAVRIVHLPTGVVAECQQERSQLKNREKAMKALRAKLYSMKLEEETSKRYNQRKIQIGNKGRSEKIRTYNFAQDRITDHRIGMTVHDVKSFLLGEDLLDEMNTSLQEFSNQETLMELLGESDQEGS
ncbi:peptide chain release factor 1-like, mitochondrial isoform X2 [Xiphias gladius]|uniref:peptide chain release factor 1-like, mitochondrial isoform X2 n=1 Tax=Xiphias gladius TaxID=8245 RepID=UPI001A982B52|nr:peptide chain release factor 1-like, mitochondrial isoform X2 [Xiphias gladius]XP_039996086.1 peptide chain release factor 1-like, mitochondrial isoform X2 [Xiphias gladius]XP_039996087.1 peptide chain release factor 1-like, mitochondrial isoform X2 [Xiphias gladius]